MTPAEKEQQKALNKLLEEHLKARTGIVLAGETEVIRLLKELSLHIVALLAALPADWKQLHLQAIRTQLEAVVAAASGGVAVPALLQIQAAWTAGEAMVDAATALLGKDVQRLQTVMPVLDVLVLRQMKAFTELRLRDVGSEAMTRISRQLGMALLGAQSPHETIKAVQKILDADTSVRATAIVRNALHQAWAKASQEKLTQASTLLPGLSKQWRRSGKIHSRRNHDVMDGVVVGAGEKFRVPSLKGGMDVMSGPHDPSAPADQVINCGCITLPWMSHWQMSTPGAKPFTEREKRLDPRKAAEDQVAKRAGRRKA